MATAEKELQSWKTKGNKTKSLQPCYIFRDIARTKKRAVFNTVEHLVVTRKKPLLLRLAEVNR